MQKVCESFPKSFLLHVETRQSDGSQSGISILVATISTALKEVIAVRYGIEIEIAGYGMSVVFVVLGTAVLKVDIRKRGMFFIVKCGQPDRAVTRVAQFCVVAYFA